MDQYQSDPPHTDEPQTTQEHHNTPLSGTPLGCLSCFFRTKGQGRSRPDREARRANRYETEGAKEAVVEPATTQT